MGERGNEFLMEMEENLEVFFLSFRMEWLLTVSP